MEENRINRVCGAPVDACPRGIFPVRFLVPPSPDMLYYTEFTITTSTSGGTDEPANTTAANSTGKTDRRGA